MDAKTKTDRLLRTAILERVRNNLEEAAHWIGEYNRMVAGDAPGIVIPPQLSEWMAGLSEMEFGDTSGK